MAGQAAAKTSLQDMDRTGTEEIKLYLKLFFFTLHGGGWATQGAPWNEGAMAGRGGCRLGGNGEKWASLARDHGFRGGAVRAHGLPGQPMPAPDLPTYRAQQNLPWPSTRAGFAMQNGGSAQNCCTSEDPDEATGSRMEAWPIK